VQAYGSKRLDASLLLIPLVGFLPAADPRIQGTLRAIEDRLLIDGEFVLRYETENADGLPVGEGAFLACSFWLVDNYILQGRYAEARKLFDRLLSRCNDVGLLAEEFDRSPAACWAIFRRPIVTSVRAATRRCLQTALP
jgi:GH15 family glucan-1,4-alpha-glucosidase